MRYRLLLTPFLLLVLTACDQVEADRAIDQRKMDLASMNGCAVCHGLHNSKIGPSWYDIAERYRNAPGARELLIQNVKNGSSDSWTELTGGAIMPPSSPRVTDKDIETLVDFVLSLKKEPE